MTRTRGQEEKLAEQGIVATPPQQLATPRRRTTKAKPQPRKTVGADAVPRPALQLASSTARNTRARTTSASQTDQPTKPARPPPKKRGRIAEEPKVAQSTDKERTSEAPRVLEVPQEPSDEEFSQAEQPPPRETPFLSPMDPITPSSFVNSKISRMLADILMTPGAPFPMDVEPAAETNTCSDKATIPENDLVDMEPGLFQTDSELSLPSLSSVPMIAPKDRLKEILHESIPAFLAMLRSNPKIAGNAVFECLLTQGEISVSIKPPNGKRKGRVAPQPTKHAPKNTKAASEFEQRASEYNDIPTSKRKSLGPEKEDPENVSPKRICVGLERKKRVPVLFDKDGMLSLRAYKEVPVKEGTSSDEENMDKSAKPLEGAFSQDQQQPERAPETPGPRGWALSSFLPSAQTVTRFLPSFSRRTPAVAPTSPTVEPTLQNQPTTPTPSAVVRTQRAISPVTPLSIQNDDRTSHSEARPITDDVERGRDREYQPATTARAPRHHRRTKSKHALKTKGEKEEIRKRDEMIASLRAQLKAQNESQAQKEAQATKAAQAAMDMAAQMEVEVQKAAQQTLGEPLKKGTKRKAESPEVIPNPPGGGFGMVLDYFGQDSDDDDEVDGDTNMNVASVQMTPTQQPSKKSRLSGGPAPPIIGSPFRATPYTGSVLALPPLPKEPANSHDSFIDTNMEAEGDDHTPTSTDTPPNGPTMTFTVPSPSDDDSEWDGSSYVEPSRTSRISTSARIPGLLCNEEQAQPSSINTTPKQPSVVNTTEKQSSPLTSKMLKPSGWTGSPSHSTLRTPSTQSFPSSWTAQSSHQASQTPSAPMLPNVALDKARQTALKHKPQQPSRLRESSRLSTSTVGTEVEEDEAAKKIVESRSPKPNVTPSKVFSYERDDQRNRKDFEEYSPEEAVSNHVQYLEKPELKDLQTGHIMRESTNDPTVIDPAPIPHESSPPIEDGPNVNGEYSSDNATSDQDLPEDLPNFASYAEYEKTMSPRVKEFLANQWTDKKGNTEAETTLASQFRNEACAIFTEQFSEFERQLDNSVESSHLGDVTEEMHDYIESVWDTADDEVAIKKFDNDFETWLKQPVY